MRYRFSTDTILSASKNRRNRLGRRSKDLFFCAAGFFQVRARERHTFKIAQGRLSDIWSCARLRDGAPPCCRSRVEVGRPDTQEVTQVVHRGSPRSPCVKTGNTATSSAELPS